MMQENGTPIVEVFARLLQLDGYADRPYDWFSLHQAMTKYSAVGRGGSAHALFSQKGSWQNMGIGTACALKLIEIQS